MGGGCERSIYFSAPLGAEADAPLGERRALGRPRVHDDEGPRRVRRAAQGQAAARLGVAAVLAHAHLVAREEPGRHAARRRHRRPRAHGLGLGVPQQLLELRAHLPHLPHAVELEQVRGARLVRVRVAPALGRDDGLLLRRVRVVLDAAAVRQRVVHQQFLPQVADEPLLLPREARGVRGLDLLGRVLDAHHALRQAQRGHGLLEVRRLGPHAREEQRGAVPAERVLQDARQLRLAVGDVLRGALREADDALLQVREALVDVHGLLLHRRVDVVRRPVGALHGLLEALRARQVHQIELGRHDLLAHARPALLPQRHGEDGVRPVRVAVQLVLRRRPRELARVEQVERLGLGRDLDLRQAPHEHAPPPLLLDDLVVVPRVLVAERLEQVEDALVVDLHVRAHDRVLRLDARGHVGEDVREGPRRDAAVDVVVHVAEHREGLARARLAVRHDRAVDAVHHVLHDVARERLVDRVLARVVEHVVEPEVEARLGVVADAVGTRLVALVDRDGVAVRVDGDVARRELGRRPRPNAHLDGLAHALAVVGFYAAFCVPRSRLPAAHSVPAWRSAAEYRMRYLF